MSFKTVIAGVAAVAIVAGTALVSTDASAQRGGHGGGGHGGGGVGGGFRGGGGVGGEAFAAFAVSAAGMAAGAGFILADFTPGRTNTITVRRAATCT